MTAAIVINKNDGVTSTTATGGETTIDFDFPIFDEDHIQIYETNLGGNISPLIKDTHYSVPTASVNAQAGGTINLLAGQYPDGAAAGHKFTARLTVPEERETDFQENGDFFAETVNRELDLITQQIQQLRRDVNSSATFREDVSGKQAVLPAPEENKLIAYADDQGTMKAVALADLSTTLNSLLSALGDDQFIVYQASGNVFVNKTVTEVQNILGVIKNNYEATTDPTSNDDNFDGYTVGSRWINNTDGGAFFCKSAAVGAAIWEADDIQISDLGGVVTKDFTIDFANPNNNTVPGTLATKNYIDGRLPFIHVQHTEPQNTAGGAAASGQNNIRKINTLEENSITNAGIVYDLAFENQTSNFTPGQVITGGTSGATGLLVYQTDDGATGVLSMINISGTFSDNEILTDPLGGSAIVLNSPAGQVPANKIWLPQNTYRSDIIAYSVVSGNNHLILWDAINNTEIVRGINAFERTATGTYGHTFLRKKFTLAQDTLVEVRHYTSSGHGSVGLGNAHNRGVETYMDAIFTQVN